jgi:hypothetical protein
MPEMLVTKALSDGGHQVHVLRCDGSLSKYCPVMTAYGQSFETSNRKKQKICLTCKNSRELLDNHSGVNAEFFAAYLSPDDIIDIDTILDSINFDNFEKFKIDELPIGKFACYEILLNHKISDMKQMKDVWEEYVENLRQCLTTYKAVSKYLLVNQIDRVVVYNSLYSLNRTTVKCAERLGIPWSTIHGGKNIENMLETLTISSSDSHDLLLARSNEWHEWKDIPLKSREILSVKNNLEYILSAKSAFTYSTSKKRTSPTILREKYHIDQGKKVLLCVLSSADERFAADVVESLDFQMTSTETSIFANTHEWLSNLISFIEKHQEFHMIIRVHPREFPNHRESVESIRGIELVKLSEQQHTRVSWNLPSDDTSLYDLAEITDVVLNGTSTAGIELMALGLPVVVFDSDKLFSYPGEFNYTGETHDDYERAIQKAAEDGWSLKNSINAFRYRSFLFNVVTLSLDDAIPSRTTWSMERVVDGLRNRKNWPIPLTVQNRIRRRELSQCSEGLTESALILRAITENSETVASLIRPTYERSEIKEQQEILQVLNDLAIKYFNIEEEIGIGRVIQQRVEAAS